MPALEPPLVLTSMGRLQKVRHATSPYLPYTQILSPSLFSTVPYILPVNPFLGDLTQPLSQGRDGSSWPFSFPPVMIPISANGGPAHHQFGFGNSILESFLSSSFMPADSFFLCFFLHPHCQNQQRVALAFLHCIQTSILSFILLQHGSKKSCFIGDFI